MTARRVAGAADSTLSLVGHVRVATRRFLAEMALRFDHGQMIIPPSWDMTENSLYGDQGAARR
jgi:hypothetical protein